MGMIAESLSIYTIKQALSVSLHVGVRWQCGFDPFELAYNFNVAPLRSNFVAYELKKHNLCFASCLMFSDANDLAVESTVSMCVSSIAINTVALSSAHAILIVGSMKINCSLSIAFQVLFSNRIRQHLVILVWFWSGVG
ncbi:hypothetical protein AKJ16_DCAP02460 [Drosera capensis]